MYNQIRNQTKGNLNNPFKKAVLLFILSIGMAGCATDYTFNPHGTDQGRAINAAFQGAAGIFHDSTPNPTLPMRAQPYQPQTQADPYTQYLMLQMYNQ